MGSLRRLLLAAVLPLVAGLAVAGCALGQSESVEDCMRDFPAGMRSTMPPAVAAEVSVEQLRTASRGLCEELVGSVPDDADETEVRRIMSETVRARPETWRPICDLLVEADVRLTGPALRYVSDRDLTRYRGS